MAVPSFLAGAATAATSPGAQLDGLVLLNGLAAAAVNVSLVLAVARQVRSAGSRRTDDLWSHR